MADLLARLQNALAGKYTIERELGAGGMATVYLAEDVRHHRKVALKVLRPEIAVTVGAGRFAREIEVAARLQHPNILPLLDSGEAAGFFFYVMPYVEGESLRDRLARGGELPIHDAARILMEVADALSHAHAHGVVHRDIKPDNVMLLGRHAVVTDFGVAKAVTEATGRQVLTSAGVALGTPAYMAPEQATADPHQDHRVDIYALGVLGYELLTGRAPFSATTAQEMLAAHITAEPEPLEQYRPTVSPALAQIVMKCLAKKPADRWQTADELLTHLEPLATPSGGTTPTRPVSAPGQLPRWARGGAGAALLAVVALVASQLLKPGALAITASGVTQVTSDAGVEFQPAISPDGNEVAYAAGPITLAHLFVRNTANVAGGAAVRLGDTTLGSEWLPEWSSDGQSVRFMSCPGRLGFCGSCCSIKETGKLGGAVRTITLPPRARWPAWSPDGRRVAYVRFDTIFTSSATDTEPRRLAIHPGWGYGDLHSLAWSPEGTRIAYVMGNEAWRTTANVSSSCIWVVDVNGGVPRQVTTFEHLNISPSWLDERHLLFVSDREGPRAVYVVEVKRNGSRGAPRAIPGFGDAHSISYSIGSRRLAFSKLILRQNIWAYPLGRPAPTSIRDGRPVTTGTQAIETHDVSPDGRWIVYSGNLRGRMDLYKMALGGGQPVPLTSGTAGSEAGRWSPSGREIVFHAGDSLGQVMLMPAEGGSPVALTRGPRPHNFPSWGSTDLEVLFESDQSGRWATWLMRRDSVAGTWHRPSLLMNEACYGPAWAPDGSGALCSGDSGVTLYAHDGRMVWRRDLRATSGVSLQGLARYSRDGRTIYDIGSDKAGRRGIWAIPVAGGAPRLAIAFDDPALVAYPAFSVGPDHLYLTVSQYESDIWVANLRW